MAIPVKRYKMAAVLDVLQVVRTLPDYRYNARTRLLLAHNSLGSNRTRHGFIVLLDLPIGYNETKNNFQFSRD